MACTECLTYFAGQSQPTSDTSCEKGKWYNNMLGLDESSWEITREKPTKEWNMVTFFKKFNSQFHTHLSMPLNNTIICPYCRDLFKFWMGIDERGLSYRVDDLKLNHLRIIQIAQTNQLIQHCEYCDSIWQAYQESLTKNYGGTLEIYLALLGIINYPN
ncbi:MAG: hypothetical protein LBU34_07075 [Planctomycetaceae bacterium]|jgi:uncharacterized Zn-finger protein|nr:hypothetical protein [Planctomycetaceae bacterium]